MNKISRFFSLRLPNFQNLVNVYSLCFTLLIAASLNAQQWQQVDALPSGQTTALFVLGDTLFAAGLNKIYRTYDGGDTWDSTAVISPTLDYISAVRFSQGRLYVGTEFEGVFSSANGGQTWVADKNGLTGLGAINISSLAIRGDSLYAGTYGAKVFVKKISTNSNWAAYNTGLLWGNIESVTNIDGTLLAGSGGNATVSVQAYPGHTWTEIPFAVFSGEINSFLGVIRQGDVLLAAGNLGLYRSADQGANWTPYNPGTGFLGSARFVVAGDHVIANLAKPVGLTYLKYTGDQGLSWQDFEPPITGSYGYDIALCNGKLYSARSNGLWRVALTTSIEDPLGGRPELDRNFPNPFSGSTVVPFTLHRSGRVEVVIFDAAGAYIRTLWSGEKTAGAHQITFDAANLPAGSYICRLTTESGVAARLMILQK